VKSSCLENRFNSRILNFVLLSSLTYSLIWLIPLVDDHQCKIDDCLLELSCWVECDLNKKNCIYS